MPYSPKFLSGVTVGIPDIDRHVHPKLVASVSKPKKYEIDSEHYSVVISKERRLAVVSACNIHGRLLPKEKILRKGSFKNHPDVDADDQLGTSFYELCGSLLDKGHLTKYEDVMWGEELTVEDFQELGTGTNYYPNAVPQHRRMNRGLWSSLELYILDTETEHNEIKICLFTGPVLNKMDPVFKKSVGDKTIQLPLHFWKIIVYKKKGKLYALGFMMSHKSLLEKSKLVRLPGKRGPIKRKEEIYFNDYKHSKPYQVRVEQIEQLAGIRLKANKPIEKPFKDDRPLEILFREIDVRKMGELRNKKFLTSVRFTNMVTG